jgi:hypothetical protein
MNKLTSALQSPLQLTYARLLDDVSRLDENAIDDANK